MKTCIMNSVFVAHNTHLPANTEATAAMKNDRTTAGPATYLDRAPGRTYTPTPMVLPTPSAVRSVVVSTLSSMDDSRTTPAIVFFRFNFCPTAIFKFETTIITRAAVAAGPSLARLTCSRGPPKVFVGGGPPPQKKPQYYY